MDVILSYVQKDQAKTDASITRLEERLQELQKQESCNVLDHATAFAQLHSHDLRSPNAKPEEKMALLKSLPSSIQPKPAVVATLEALERVIASKGKVSASSPTDAANVLFDHGQCGEAAKLYKENLPAP